MLGDDGLQLVTDLIEGLCGIDGIELAVHPLLAGQQPVRVVDTVDLAAALGACIALGDGVVVVTADIHHLAVGDVHFQATEDVAETAESFLRLNRLVHCCYLPGRRRGRQASWASNYPSKAIR